MNTNQTINNLIIEAMIKADSLKRATNHFHQTVNNRIDLPMHKLSDLALDFSEGMLPIINDQEIGRASCRERV